MFVLANFWEDLWDNIVNFFKTIGEFFTRQDANGMNLVMRIVIAIIVLVIGVIAIKLFILLLKKAAGIKKGLKLDVSAKSFFIAALKITLYFALAFAIVAILGVDISGAVGILSAVTVALGLALQDIIGMFASGLLIFHTKNFKTGDYIKVTNSFGSEEGKVYCVSLLYTTLLTINGQKVHIPNNNVTKANLTNYAMHDVRRGIITFNIPYEVDASLVTQTLLKCLEKDDRVLKDPASSAIISEFKEFAVSYDLRFYTKLDDYWDTMFNVRILALNALKENDIKIATTTALTIKEKSE